eukprot:CAMPEP_0118902138 /NCGR_PEP_ID=MMETSP1166-20130328/7558_1 /TAXON_ID=1104430 /ORGANISM="Chrysoreinhardia sp, Strain CCMP3193" /LENGTH=239 /DNA_ID=CAMNT_0006841339 /DNA_START=36 /DNA_END=755 /DNA_ORIENTATION=+
MTMLNKLPLILFLVSSQNAVVAFVLSSPALRTTKVCGFLDNLRNPFDDRPGATVGLVQVALTNEQAQATKFIGDAARKLDSSSARGLARFVSEVCTGLCRRQDAWLYAHSTASYFGPGAAERQEHERYYNRMVNAEAVKFEKEYLPSAAELAKAEEDGSGGLCVISLVVAIEGDVRDIFEGSSSSIRSLRAALTDLSATANVDGGYALYNAEVLWTPSSPKESLLRDEMLLDFPELLAL